MHTVICLCILKILTRPHTHCTHPSLQLQAVGRFVCVHDLKTSRIVWWLDGHTANVTATAFAEHRHGCVVSVSEDRTFIVWDLVHGDAIFTSQVESPTPFVAVAVDTALDRVAVGAVDGVVRFYSLRNYTLLHVFDLSVELSRRYRLAHASTHSSSSPHHPVTSTPSRGTDDHKAGAAQGPPNSSIVVKARRSNSLTSSGNSKIPAGEHATNAMIFESVVYFEGFVDRG